MRSILTDAAMPARTKPISYAALLRGINLGSHKRIGMGELRELVEDLGCSDVRTYVQSGNVVLRSDRRAPDLAQAIENAIEKRFRHDVTVVIRTGRQLRDLVRANPFVRQKSPPKALYATFLAEKPEPKRVRSLAERDFAPERWELVGEDICLLFPNGYGRVKLNNAMFERQLGVPATTRNWRTVTALAELTASG
jgi:uncharacterized protein (DUF1697 family)